MKKLILSKSIRLAAVGCVLIFPMLGMADTATLAGDAYVNTGDPTNFGNSPNLNVGGAGPSSSYIMFDLSSLPSGTVAWARLRI
jgi:hypothetical protein